MTIAIDLDDTILDTKNVLPGYRMGQPMPGAILSTQRLAMEGHEIIIFTARNVQIPSVFKAVEDWCRHFNIPIHGITNIKRPEFDVYIDNRAMNFKDWPTTMSHLTRFINSGTILNNETTHA